jgi:hypothetical protein
MTILAYCKGIIPFGKREEQDETACRHPSAVMQENTVRWELRAERKRISPQQPIRGGFHDELDIAAYRTNGRL